MPFLCPPFELGRQPQHGVAIVAVAHFRRPGQELPRRFQHSRRGVSETRIGGAPRRRSGTRFSAFSRRTTTHAKSVPVEQAPFSSDAAPLLERFVIRQTMIRFCGFSKALWRERECIPSTAPAPRREADVAENNSWLKLSGFDNGL